MNTGIIIVIITFGLAIFFLVFFLCVAKDAPEKQTYYFSNYTPQTPPHYSSQISRPEKPTNFIVSSHKEDENKDDLVCPFCGSLHVTPLQYSVPETKGFRIGRSLVGGLLLGPVGLAAGFIGSGKIKEIKTEIKLKCLKCGHEWDIQ